MIKGKYYLVYEDHYYKDGEGLVFGSIFEELKVNNKLEAIKIAKQKFKERLSRGESKINGIIYPKNPELRYNLPLEINLV